MQNVVNYLFLNGTIVSLSKADVEKVIVALGLNTTKTENKADEKSSSKTSAKATEKKTSTKAKTENKATENIIIRCVGSLNQHKYIVWVGNDARLSRNARYAISKKVEEFGGMKASPKSDNTNVVNIYNWCRQRSDKYVQAYYFRSEEDAKNFMDDQARSYNEWSKNH